MAIIVRNRFTNNRQIILIYSFWLYPQVAFISIDCRSVTRNGRIINSNAIYCLKTQITGFSLHWVSFFSPDAVFYRKKKCMTALTGNNIAKIIIWEWKQTHSNSRNEERKKNNRKKFRITLSCRQPSTNAMVMHFMHGKGKWTFRIVDKLRQQQQKIVWVYV